MEYETRFSCSVAESTSVALLWWSDNRKDARFGQMQQAAMELKCAGMKGGLEPGDELAAEHAAEHLMGRKKRRDELIHRVWSGDIPPESGEPEASV